MSRLSLEIPGSRYYSTLPPRDPPSISHNFDSRGESPPQPTSAPHESPYSSLNGAVHPPAAPPVYPPPEVHGAPPQVDSLHPAHLRLRRDLLPSSHPYPHPPYPHQRAGPERTMNSRRGRSHSPYPHMGQMPDPSSSQRTDSRFRNPPVGGSYPHPHQQDLSPSSQYPGGNPGSHIYTQQPYPPEAMPYTPAQPHHYPPPDPDRFPHTRNRQREPENVPTLSNRGSRNPTQSSKLNYRLLMETYSDIMTVAAKDHTMGDIRGLGDMMRNPALSGLRHFENAGENASPISDSRPGEGSFHRPSIAPGAASGPSSPPQGRRGRDVRAEGQVCKGCDATSTPEWRRGPLGPRTLCNACGLVYAKMLKRRSREANAAKSGAHKPQEADSADEGMSEPDTTESPVSDPHDRRQIR